MSRRQWMLAIAAAVLLAWLLVDVGDKPPRGELGLDPKTQVPADPTLLGAESALRNSSTTLVAHVRAPQDAPFVREVDLDLRITVRLGKRLGHVMIATRKGRVTSTAPVLPWSKGTVEARINAEGVLVASLSGLPRGPGALAARAEVHPGLGTAEARAVTFNLKEEPVRVVLQLLRTAETGTVFVRAEHAGSRSRVLKGRVAVFRDGKRLSDHTLTEAAAGIGVPANVELKLRLTQYTGKQRGLHVPERTTRVGAGGQRHVTLPLPSMTRVKIDVRAPGGGPAIAGLLLWRNTGDGKRHVGTVSAFGPSRSSTYEGPLPEGRYTILVLPVKVYPSKWAYFTVDPNGPPHHERVFLDPAGGHGVEVKLVDENGAPVPNARLQIVSEGMSLPQFDAAFVTTDDKGVGASRPLLPGTTYAAVDWRGGHTWSLGKPSSSVHLLKIPVPASANSGAVLQGTLSQAPKGRNLGMLRFCFQRKGSASARFIRLRPNGHFTVNALEEGEYEYWIPYSPGFFPGVSTMPTGTLIIRDGQKKATLQLVWLKRN